MASDYPRCTRREHVVSRYHDGRPGVATIPEDDERLFRCDCGLVLIGNGQVEIRFGLLPHLFPEPAALKDDRLIADPDDDVIADAGLALAAERWRDDEEPSGG